MTVSARSAPSGSAVLERRAELIEFGAVPILSYQWPDSEQLNARLQQVILAKMTASHGLVDTNVGGWHSDRDLPTWNDPAIATLLDRVRAMARELVAATVRDPMPAHLEGWKIEGWANVNRRGAYNKAHHHAGGRGNRNVWSGIYYVAEGSAGSGLTGFEDRSGVPKEILRTPNPFERELRIEPRAGLMVFFPATLRHYVTPYEGDGDRITIALNLKHDGFIIPRYPEAEPPTFLWRNLRGPMLVMSRLKRILLRQRKEYA
jgi:uncharacterized protein (TIGR02466 family)